MRHVVGIAADLVVEGDHDGGPFRGRVIAMALEEDNAGRPPAPEATWLLVADDQRPSPIWVTQAQVSAQRLGR